MWVLELVTYMVWTVGRGGTQDSNAPGMGSHNGSVVPVPFTGDAYGVADGTLHL